jgi:hypothetical protein
VSEFAKVTAPADFLGKMTGELARSLESNKRQLLSLLGFSEFLCCVSVANRERAAGRITAPAGKAERIAGLISSLGIHCHRSMFDLLPQPDLAGGEHVNHHAIYVPQGSEEGARAVLYFGIDAEFAHGAETAELSREQVLVGQLFGYPQCCSDFFLQNSGFNEDRTPQSIPDTGPFLSILNPVVAELFELRLLFHFACSPRCLHSLKIVRDRLNYLTPYAPSIAMMEKLGGGLTIYGPSTGAALVSRYSQTAPGTYAVEEVITCSGKARDLFSGNGHPTQIHLHSAHNFEIGDRTFNDDYHFAAIFSENGAG